jgi:hypothetical protein
MKGGVPKKTKKSAVKAPVKASIKIKNPSTKISKYVLYDINRRKMRGGDSTLETVFKPDTFENQCNMENLFVEIDLVVKRLESFLESNQKFRINGQEFPCEQKVKEHIEDIVKFLKTEMRSNIDKIDINLPAKEYAVELTKWFPIQILFAPEDMNTVIHPSSGTEIYYSPKNVPKLFPQQEDKIEGFQNSFPSGSFEKFALNGQEKPSSTNSSESRKLIDILVFLQKEFSELRESDELKNAREIIEYLNTNKFSEEDLVESEDFKDLVDYSIDFGVIGEHDILKEFLRYICDYDDIYAATCYSILLPMSYFHGHNIYDYDILNNFVGELKEDVLQYNGNYESIVGIFETDETNSRYRFDVIDE